MAVGLTQDPVAADLARRTADFVRNMVIPAEEQHRGVARTENVRIGLQRAAKDAGVFAPHVGTEFGGHAVAPLTAAGLRALTHLEPR
ncbi:hypothetical protein [Streptomyces sp. P3]|uniref:hypothetical protein n=1 Tax=Streptomyces sp. P3 TaxID=2135430 RepID=UPI001C20030B|nr:hypothetical protein [Streptomyces sp. P3]